MHRTAIGVLEIGVYDRKSAGGLGRGGHLQNTFVQPSAVETIVKDITEYRHLHDGKTQRDSRNQNDFERKLTVINK